MDHLILSKYLVEYKSQPRAFKETLAISQFIQLKEERRSCNKREIKGNRFLLPTYDGSSTSRAWARKLEEFFLLHLVVEREAIEFVALHLEGEANVWWFSQLSHARVTFDATTLKFRPKENWSTVMWLCLHFPLVSPTWLFYFLLLFTEFVEFGRQPLSILFDD